MNKFIIVLCIFYGFTFQVCAKEPLPVRPPPEISTIGNELPVPSKITGPRWPIQVLNKRQTGWVQVGFKISTNGKPLDIRVVDSSPKKILDRSVMKAIKKWSFNIPSDYTEDKEYLYLLELKWE